MARKQPASGKGRVTRTRKVPPRPPLRQVAAYFSGILLQAASLNLPRAQQCGALGEAMGDPGLTAAQRSVVDRVHEVVHAVNDRQLYTPGDGTVAEGLGLLVGLAFCLQEERVDITSDAIMAGHLLIRVVHEAIDRCEGARRRSRTATGGKSAKAPKSPAPKSKPATPEAGVIFQFKVTLLGTRPAIWRRIQVRDCTFTRLHHHIQAAMGWTNSHLHQFHLGGKVITNPSYLEMGPLDFQGLDASKVTLGQLLKKGGKGASFLYEYDFGDGWEHRVTLEKRLDPGKGVRYPRCLEGENACPPEDCGGVGGFYDMLKAVRNPAHAEHAHHLEWLGGEFDPARFDPAQATRAMMTRKPTGL